MWSAAVPMPRTREDIDGSNLGLSQLQHHPVVQYTAQAQCRRHCLGRWRSKLDQSTIAETICIVHRANSRCSPISGHDGIARWIRSDLHNSQSNFSQLPDGTNTTPALNRHEVNIPSVQPFLFLSRTHLGFKTVTAYLWGIA
jgi:hypothetical protein